MSVINNKAPLLHIIMAWRKSGDESLSKRMGIYFTDVSMGEVLFYRTNINS